MTNPKTDYSEWKRTKQDVGCIFARKIANRPRYHRQRIEVVDANSSPARIAASVAARVTRLVETPTVDGAALLFPKIDSLEALAKGLLALHGQPHWGIGFSALTHPVVGDLVAVALARNIPFGESAMLPSEALVLGPYDIFPATRRAPVAALEVYVGTPKELDPKTQGAVTKANLAHMDIRLPNQRAFDAMWQKSAAGRLASLGGTDDLRAKAKVAFVLPVALANSLGISP